MKSYNVARGNWFPQIRQMVPQACFECSPMKIPNFLFWRFQLSSSCRFPKICFWLLVISYCLHSQNMPGEPPGVAWGNRFPQAALYDFLTLPVRTPQAQLGWVNTSDFLAQTNLYRGHCGSRHIFLQHVWFGGRPMSAFFTIKNRLHSKKE